MNKLHRYLILLALSLNATFASAQYIIKGTVAGFDGKPMVRADIFLLSNESRFPRYVIKSYEVNTDGSFSINLAKAGLHRLRFTGVNHQEYETVVYLSTPDEVVLDVHLAAIQYKEAITDVTFMIDYGGEINKYREKITVTANDEGLFVAEVTAVDSIVTYHLGKIDKNNHTVNGPQADHFIPDGSDYLSVIRARPDSVVRIVLNPEKLIHSSEPASHTIVSAPEETYKFDTIHEDYTKRYQAYHDYVMKGREKGIYDNDYANNYGWKNDFKELDKLIKTEKDPFLLQGWYLLRIKIAMNDAWAKPRAKISKELAEKALKAIPPDSPLWSYHPNAMLVALRYASEIDKSFPEAEKQFYFMQEFGRPFMSYIGKAVEQHPDSTIYRTLLGSAIGNAYKFQEFELFDAYYSEYMDKYPGTPGADAIEKHYAPSRRIKPGQKVPAFTFESMDDPHKEISAEDLLGKKYIINFWGTWCGSCKPSLEALTRIHEEFGGPRFEIISVSLCFRKELAVQFRKEKLPMPWFNCHLDNWKPKQGVLYDFEVAAIPKIILVDEKGFIEEVYDLEKMVEILRKQ